MATINEKALKKELVSLKQREKEITEILKKQSNSNKIGIGLLSYDIFHNFILNSTLNGSITVRNPATFHLMFLYGEESIWGLIQYLVMSQDNTNSICIQSGTANNITCYSHAEANAWSFVYPRFKQYHNKNNYGACNFGITGFYPMINYKEN